MHVTNPGHRTVYSAWTMNEHRTCMGFRIVPYLNTQVSESYFSCPLFISLFASIFTFSLRLAALRILSSWLIPTELLQLKSGVCTFVRLVFSLSVRDFFLMCVRERSVHFLARRIFNHSVDSIFSMHQCLINAKTVEADAKFKKHFGALFWSTMYFSL